MLMGYKSLVMVLIGAFGFVFVFTSHSMKNKIHVICYVFIVVWVLGVVVQCNLERRDVHRIVLKPQRTKKHKKHNRPKEHSTHFHHEIDYEPHSLSSNFHSEEVSYNSYEKPRYKSNRHHNHHEYYYDLTRPKPPKENFVITYPEEESSYRYQEPNNHHYEYLDKKPIKNVAETWTPLSNQDVIGYTHQSYSTTVPNTKKKKRKPPKTTTEFPITKPTKKFQFTTNSPIIHFSATKSFSNFGAKSPPKTDFNKFPTSKSPKTSKLHSYEVHEDVVDLPGPIKPSNFDNLLPLSSYSFRGPVIPSISPLFSTKNPMGSQNLFKNKSQPFPKFI